MFLPFFALFLSFFGSAEFNGVFVIHKGVAWEFFAVSAMCNAIFLDTFFDVAVAEGQRIFSGKSVASVAGLAEFGAAAGGANYAAGRLDGFEDSAFDGLEVLVWAGFYVVNGLAKLRETDLVFGHRGVEDSAVVEIFGVIENFVAVSLKFFNCEVKEKFVVGLDGNDTLGFEDTSVFFQKYAACEAAFCVSSLGPGVGEIEEEHIDAVGWADLVQSFSVTQNKFEVVGLGFVCLFGGNYHDIGNFFQREVVAVGLCGGLNGEFALAATDLKPKGTVAHNDLFGYVLRTFFEAGSGVFLFSCSHDSISFM